MSSLAVLVVTTSTGVSLMSGIERMKSKPLISGMFQSVLSHPPGRLHGGDRALPAVAGLGHVLVSELVQRVDDDAAHRAGVVDDQKAHVDILSRLCAPKRHCLPSREPANMPKADRLVSCVIGGAKRRFRRMSNEFARTPSPTDLLTLNRATTVARLLAGVAHEVNNALQVIGGTTELLQVTPGLPASVADGLQRIAVQNARAATAIQEVMLFARQKVDAMGHTNLREVARRSVALRAFAIGRARLSVRLDSPSTGRFLVTGNDALLQLAVLNLIVNAEQALAGQMDGAIRLELEESQGSVSLRISDNGPGIEAAAAESLFESFFTTRPREEASGLGLSVARSAVEQCGGTLTLLTRDIGACFEIRLPAAG